MFAFSSCTGKHATQAITSKPLAAAVSCIKMPASYRLVFSTAAKTGTGSLTPARVEGYPRPRIPPKTAAVL